MTDHPFDAAVMLAPAADGPYHCATHPEMRFVTGAWPDFEAGVPQEDSETAMWVRDEPPRPLDALALAAICDVCCPRVFRRRPRFTPAGTVSITTFFRADAAALAAQGVRPVFAQARAQRFVQGFHDQSATVLGDDGSLLASSHRIVHHKA